MSEERKMVESVAETVEEAIKAGLEDLGVSERDVEIEILEEGGKGIFGLGHRQASVRITLLDLNAVVKTEDARAAEPIDSSAGLSEDAEIENTMSIARETVMELLDKMHVVADVDVRVDEGDDEDHRPNIVVDINGDDLSYLIGKRAETLNALQYITRLIVGKEIGRASNVMVDVEGYRSRREQNLQQLAERMAKQAINSGEEQPLEPMTPADRRIVHIALRDFEGVYTESSGEEPRRKVVIVPEAIT